MTIKQLGGIFGRNPTFNDVDVEGDQSITGDLDVSGDVSIGQSGSVTNLNLLRASANYVNASSSGGYFIFRTGGTTKKRLEIQDDGDVYFFDTAGTTAQMTYTASNSNLSFPSGSGLDFSATSGTGTSELFDDSEEGTWPTTLGGSTSAGTATFVTGPTGIYTKIGNQVTVYFDWNISAHTGTGALRVTGLPFAKGAGVGVGTIMDGNYTYSAGRTKLVPYVVSNSILRIYQTGSGVGYIENVLDTSHQINGSVTYTV